MAMIMTIMPTRPRIEPRIIRTIDRPVIPVSIIGIAVAVVVTVVVIDTAQYQCRRDPGANSPAPSMTMRFRTIGGAEHDHQGKSRGGDECWNKSGFHSGPPPVSSRLDAR